MATCDEKEASEKNLSRAEKIALQREIYKQKQKEQAKAAKKAYLAKPEVQARLKAQKEKLAAQRKAKSAAIKAARKGEKKALAESKKLTREKRQQARDEELMDMLGRASNLASDETRDITPVAPKLTLIKGGRVDPL